MVSVYNGRKFRFEVYIDNVISTTPKFSNSEKNESIDVVVPQGEEGDKTFTFYYEATTEKNGLEVIIPVKKHNKKSFFEAIESQLMYVPNIVFKHKGKDEVAYKTEDIAAKILYRDDNIVISDNKVFDKPHILLGAGEGLINYGFVSFAELELEPKRGAVGLILDINSVEVTPSRESVVWSPMTRASVLESYSKVVKTATKMINDDLSSEPDYFKWIVKAASIKVALSSTATSTTASTLQKLAGIVDVSAINKIIYTQGKFTKLFVSETDSMFGDKLLVRLFEYDKYAHKINRTKLKSVNTLSHYPKVYITDGASDKYRDRYIIEDIAKSPFIVVKKLAGWNLEYTSKLIGTSTAIEDYDSVIVPQDVLDRYLLEEQNNGVILDDESVSIVVDSNKLAQLRKQEQKILYHQAYVADPVSYTKVEIKISEIADTFRNQVVIYGSFNDRELINDTLSIMPSPLLSFRNEYNSNIDYELRNKADSWNWYFGKHQLIKINAVLIAADVVKLFESLPNFIHISKFVVDSYINKKIVFSKYIKHVITFNVINKILKEYNIYIQSCLLLTDSRKVLLGEEFTNALILSTLFKQGSLRSSLSEFFKSCSNYHLRQNSDDQLTVNEYLKEIDKYLPDSLCEIIDEVESVDILDLTLINAVTEYVEFYKPYFSIICQLRIDSDITTLKSLITNYANAPTTVLGI